MTAVASCSCAAAGRLRTRLCGRGHDIGRRAMRKIIHVDMDAFYAAIEQRDDPSLRGRPIAVGSARRSRGRDDGKLRGAAVRRALGDAVGPGDAPVPRTPLRAAALRRLQAGEPQIRAIFARYTDLIEPLSLDEAYLDVTEPKSRADLRPGGSPARSRRPSRPKPGSPPRLASRSTSSWPRSPPASRSPTG